MNINRKVMSMAIASAFIVGATVPGVASAKKVKVNMSQIAKTDGIKLTGTVKGKPFGKCTVKGTVTVPVVRVTWKCKGGTVKLATDDATIKGAFFVSTSKLTGTGKYKKLKGKTKNKGSVNGGPGTFIGTATY